MCRCRRTSPTVNTGLGQDDEEYVDDAAADPFSEGPHDVPEDGVSDAHHEYGTQPASGVSEGLAASHGRRDKQDAWSPRIRHEVGSNERDQYVSRSHYLGNLLGLHWFDEFESHRDTNLRGASGAVRVAVAVLV